MLKDEIIEQIASNYTRLFVSGGYYELAIPEDQIVKFARAIEKAIKESDNE